jgi:hypothetical protein
MAAHVNAMGVDPPIALGKEGKFANKNGHDFRLHARALGISGFTTTQVS